MKTLTLRIDSDLHRRLALRAAAGSLTISALLRPVIEDVARPGGRYVYTGLDELLTVAIQTFALIGQDVSERSLVCYQRGMHNARSMLRDRGLDDDDSQSDEVAAVPVAPSGKGAAR